jgi:hypothetical protein
MGGVVVVPEPGRSRVISLPEPNYRGLNKLTETNDFYNKNFAVKRHSVSDVPNEINIRLALSPLFFAAVSHSKNLGPFPYWLFPCRCLNSAKFHPDEG